MSGICGIFNFDGSQVSPRLLGQLAEFMAFRNPDKQETWIDGNRVWQNFAPLKLRLYLNTCTAQVPQVRFRCRDATSSEGRFCFGGSGNAPIQFKPLVEMYPFGKRKVFDKG